MTSWLKARIGRMRVSTLVLIVAFLALFWLHQAFPPEPAATQAPTPAVVPPGFVPDPSYTWVPRTDVRQQKQSLTPTTTKPTTTTPTSPGETTTTSPTSPTESTPPTPSTPVPVTPAPAPTTTTGAVPGPPPVPPAPPQ